MESLRRQPALHLNGDIPVLEVQGTWDEATGRSLDAIVSELAGAGHLELIIDMTCVAPDPQMDDRWPEVLERIGMAVRRRCGRLDVVGTLAQMQLYFRGHARSGLLWAMSEEEAVGQIKGLPVGRRGAVLNMRFSAE